MARRENIPSMASEMTVEYWHSRGYLPHFESNVKIQHVTFHLADCLAQDVLDRFEQEVRNFPENDREQERRIRIEEWLDAGHGSCVLREPELAQVVQDSLLRFDGERYDLFEWVVRPNHVHVLFRPLPPWSVRRIVASWKSFTGRRIAPAMRQAGAWRSQRTWHREQWDRYVRDETHYAAVVHYIHQNPVKARLAKAPEDFAFSSAYARSQSTTAGRASLQPGTAPEQ